MGQIVQKKKKGRPSKADLAARAAAGADSESNTHRRRRTAEEEEERDIRRSLRRRSSVRYNLLDYDEDYLEDDEDFELEFDDDEDARAVPEDDDDERREKKLKFVLKLPNGNRSGRASGIDGQLAARGRRPGRRSVSEEEQEDEDGEEEDNRIMKKRKISGDDEEDEEEEDEPEDDCADNDELEEGGRKRDSNKEAPVFRTPNDVPSHTPMPEKKQLELILDKLQKKDTYGVYAEPVDPEELPDYHEIIEHPMDFATVRRKLASGSYSILEDFESDVYLICANAMQYNTPETVYHKQARAIKELAERKFQRVRAEVERTSIEYERADKEPKPEQIVKLTPTFKKQMKKPLSRSVEPASSDFASGAALATPDAHNMSSSVHASNCVRTCNVEGVVEGISSLANGNFEKEDQQSGKGVIPKIGKKLVVDENRRATYDNSIQPVDTSESIFSTFEGETKQLIPVGLYGEHAYAQSMACFAANLGPAAWKTASKSIEQALPPGSKFGRGWIGEYEPLPTPVLFVANNPQGVYPLARRPLSPVPLKTGNPGCNLVTMTEQQPSDRPPKNGKQFLLPCSEGSRPPTPSGTVVQLQDPLTGRTRSEGSGPASPSGTAVQSHNPFAGMPCSNGSRPATPSGTGAQQQSPFVRIPCSEVNRPATPSGTVAQQPNPHVGMPFSEGKKPANFSGTAAHPQNPFLRMPCAEVSRPATPSSAGIQPHSPFDGMPCSEGSRPASLSGTAVRPQGPFDRMPYLEGSRPATPTSTIVQLQNPFVRKLQNAVLPVKDDKAPNISSPVYDHGEHRPISDVQPNSLPVYKGSRPGTPTSPSIDQQNPFVRRLQNSQLPAKNDGSPKAPIPSGGRLDIPSSSGGKPSACSNSARARPATPGRAASLQPSPFSRNNPRPEASVMNRGEPSGPTLTNPNTNYVHKQFPGAEIPTSWHGDVTARNKSFLQPLPFRPPSPAEAANISGMFPNGHSTNGFFDMNQSASSPPSGVSTQVTGTASTVPPGREQGLSDPVQVMRLLAENAQNHQKPTSSVGPFAVRPSIQSQRAGHIGGATAAAANAWMSVGAGGIRLPSESSSLQRNQISTESSYNATREPYPQILQPRAEPPVSGAMYFQPGRAPGSHHSLCSNPAKTSSEAQVQNMSPVFPNFMVTEQASLSRGQMRSPWQGLSPRTHQTQKQNQDSLPPDLNVAFAVDPQQPDLALQL